MSRAAERVARLPWVTRLEKTQPCDGYRYSHMPGYARGNQAVMDRYKCKNHARWKFRSLKKSSAKDGVYCWPHLISCGLRGDMLEDSRTDKALERMVIQEQLSTCP